MSSNKDWKITESHYKSYDMQFSEEELKQILLEEIVRRGGTVPEGSIRVYWYDPAREYGGTGGPTLSLRITKE